MYHTHTYVQQVQCIYYLLGLRMQVEIVIRDYFSSHCYIKCILLWMVLVGCPLFNSCIYQFIIVGYIRSPRLAI